MNKKYFYYSILLFLASIFLVGFGFGFGSPKFDTRNPESWSKMTSGMSIEEEGLLIKDVDLLILLFKNENKLNGYTAERIKSEARELREALIKRNIEFLKLKITDMQAKGKNSTSLLIEKSVFFSNPRAGYVAKSYSVNNLKQRLAWLMTADASEINPDGTNILTQKLDPINIDIVNQILSTETTAQAAEEAAQAQAAEEAAQAQAAEEAAQAQAAEEAAQAQAAEEAAQAQVAEETNLFDPEATDLRRCYLEVSGEIYIDDPCEGYLNNDGGFQINSPEYFAIVQIYEDGAIGFWNEEAYATHAHSDLGPMTKSGPCWKSDKATVCFWE